MAKAIRFRISYAANGNEIAGAATEKQALAIARRSLTGSSRLSILGSDGISYEYRGGVIVAVGAADPVDTRSAAQRERAVDAMVSEMNLAKELRENPNAYGTGSDADAIEDLGLGTRDGGLFRGRR